MINDPALELLTWRTSSFSGGGGHGGGNCVEVAALTDGRVAVRNSNDRAAGALLFTRAEIAAWINGVKNHEFDDLT
jgi:hypothetical protein